MKREGTDIDPRWTTGVRVALLEHFDTHARDLPWRRSRDPYAIWISEVMLQQTRVDAVVPYYDRWLQRFPDITALADAPLDDVLKEWEGLGYYSRARNLHRAAGIVCERHAGTLPQDYDALRALPGIGEYTAGAVASIAYGARRPAIDGNVRRVIARLIDDPDPTTSRLREVVAELVPATRAGDFNQALMELGAVVCTPRSPRCAECPVVRHCAACRAGTQKQRPLPKRAAAPPLFLCATAVIRAPDERVLLARRPPKGLLAGLWAFPAREVNEMAEACGVALHIARSLLNASAARGSADGGTVDAATCARRLGHAVELGTVDHAFSHRRERYICWRVDVSEPYPLRNDDLVWVAAGAAGLAMPRAQRRILNELAPRAPDQPLDLSCSNLRPHTRSVTFTPRCQPPSTPDEDFNR